MERERKREIERIGRTSSASEIKESKSFAEESKEIERRMIFSRKKGIGRTSK